MSYPYADFTVVRKLAGNPDPSDVPDTDIQSIIQSSDIHVDSETSRMGTGWQNTDPSYRLVVEASEFFAASDVIDRYFDDQLKADRHYQKAMDLCLSIRESSPQSLIIAAADYQTFPLNPTGKLHRSLPGGGGDTTMEPTGQASEDFIP